MICDPSPGYHGVKFHDVFGPKGFGLSTLIIKVRATHSRCRAAP